MAEHVWIMTVYDTSVHVQMVGQERIVMWKHVSLQINMVFFFHMHWYWDCVRNEQSQRFASESVGNGRHFVGIKNNANVLSLSISNKFWQILMQSVDFDHFWQYPNINDDICDFVWVLKNVSHPAARVQLICSTFMEFQTLTCHLRAWLWMKKPQHWCTSRVYVIFAFVMLSFFMSFCDVMTSFCEITLCHIIGQDILSGHQ